MMTKEEMQQRREGLVNGLVNLKLRIEQLTKDLQQANRDQFATLGALQEYDQILGPIDTPKPPGDA
jgi:hypothetical protein